MESIKNLTNTELRCVNKIIGNIPDNNDVFKSTKQFLCGNSKRIRSIIAILYLKMNESTITDEIISLLSAGEIIHNASLLHDDIIDGAKTRRNIKTIGEEFSPHISILMGDYLLNKAVKIVSDINNRKITDIILNCTKKMVEAEVNQYILRGKTPTANEYIQICEGKTASLFEAILQSVSIISGINEESAKNFGKNFGILFQIKNDVSQSSINADKRNKISTAYNIFGIEKTNILIDNYKENIRSILNKFPNNDYKKALEDLTEEI